MHIHPIVLSAFLMGAATASAQAAPLNPQNSDRPAAIHVNPEAPAGEKPLQQILDDLFIHGQPVHAGNDQSATGIWRSATASATTIPTIFAEYTGNAPVSAFGIWFGNATTAVVGYELLKGGASAGDAAGVSIEEGRLTVFGADCIGKVNCGIFQNDLITASAFGFWFQSGVNGQRWYTADQLNPADDYRVLAYQQGQSTNWALAFEDGSDFDYNDMVVKIESISPVPEPSEWALMLGGLGLVGMMARRRRTGR